MLCFGVKILAETHLKSKHISKNCFLNFHYINSPICEMKFCQKLSKLSKNLGELFSK